MIAAFIGGCICGGAITVLAMVLCVASGQNDDEK